MSYPETNFNGLYLDCNTSQEAWERINEYILLEENKLKSKGAGRDGNASISYDNLIYIRKAWVDPEFDFGRIFGYRIQKWTHLVNNYVDINYLDILKQDIQSRESKRQRIYQVTKHFANSHDNGKDCLISVTFSRRLNSDVPVLVFHTRATEVTKRLLIDFLLIQRMGEYVYGKEKTFSILMYCPMAYLNVEAFTMYHTHKNIRKLLKRFHKTEKSIGHWTKSLEPFQKRVIDILEKFSTIDPMKISYKSHRRAAKQLQTDKDGNPLSGDRPMKAGKLQLETKSLVEYPIDCISDKQRVLYRKTLRNKNKLNNG
jgi:hypothetical protein